MPPEAPLRDDDISPLGGVRAIGIAILALGGEGGGVLADWLIDLAEHNGFVAQGTSVPGVAQRTGATIYYVEMFPQVECNAARHEPVLALMPTPGDVDLVIASELMEAGRAVQRGLVTQDRTTFVFSTNRVFAMTEKMAMDDGRADASALLDACRRAAKRAVAADMQALAEANHSVISAVLLGAVAGSGALAFSRAAYEDAIRRGKVGVEASLAAFAAGFAAATADGSAPGARSRRSVPAPPPGPLRQGEWEKQTAPRSSPPPAGGGAGGVKEPPLPDGSLPATGFPWPAAAIVAEGVRRLADYQDARYADAYVARLRPVAALDVAHGDGTARLLAETARHLALWMSYEDTIRVADLKIRAERFARVREEARAQPDQVLRIREFLHPRVQEIAETLPARVGRWLLRSGMTRRAVSRLTARGRRVETTSLTGFASLWLVASLRRWRRRTLRYALEQNRINAWLARIAAMAPLDYALAVELARCQGLVKGYGDTHERGLANFERLMRAVEGLRGNEQAAARLAGLRGAALADETGQALTKALAEAGVMP